MSLEQITQRITDNDGMTSPDCEEDCCMPMKDRAALHAAVTAVLAIHHAEDVCDTDRDDKLCMLCDVTDPPELLRVQNVGGWDQHVHRARWCDHCYHRNTRAVEWPCATVQAITQATGEPTA